jgi:hypothetical protein
LFLVKGRLSQLWLYSRAQGYYEDVCYTIHNKGQQKKLGWKTISRLARMVGDKELMEEAALKSGSVDSQIKAGVR